MERGKMRREKKEIRDRGTIDAVLATAAVGHLGTLGADGWPRIKPLNFAWHRGRVYFHSAREGEKIRDIGRDPRVCFEVDQPLAYVRARTQPCQATYLFRSVILRGRAGLVEDPEERQEALAALMAKYQPGEDWSRFPEDKLGLTAVVRIDPGEVVGKEDLGTEAQRQAIEAALAVGTPFPLHLA